MPALVVRGQVYLHLHYTYPDGGNVADKRIIVLNKLHLPTQPIIVVPTKTYVHEGKFSPGYKPDLQQFFISAHQDCFENDTQIQLYVLGLTAAISEDEFKACQASGVISPKPIAALRRETIVQICDCFVRMKEDIRMDYQQHIL
jgi:uncharacterized protein YifN (PemK superfamily)